MKKFFAVKKERLPRRTNDTLKLDFSDTLPTIVSHIPAELCDNSLSNLLSSSDLTEDISPHKDNNLRVVLVSRVNTLKKGLASKGWTFINIEDNKSLSHHSKTIPSLNDLSDIVQNDDVEILVNDLFYFDGSYALPVSMKEDETIGAKLGQKIVESLSKVFDVIVFVGEKDKPLLSSSDIHFTSYLTYVSNDSEEKAATSNNEWVIPILSDSYRDSSMSKRVAALGDKKGNIIISSRETQAEDYALLASIILGIQKEASRPVRISRNLDKINALGKHLESKERQLIGTHKSLEDYLIKPFQFYLVIMLIAGFVGVIAGIGIEAETHSTTQNLVNNLLLWSFITPTFGLITAVPILTSIHHVEKLLRKLGNYPEYNPVTTLLDSYDVKKTIVTRTPKRIDKYGLMFLFQKENQTSTVADIRQKYKTLEEKWLHYELDLINCIKYPAFIDMEVDSTRDFHIARSYVDSLLNDKSGLNTLDKQKDLVKSFSTLEVAFKRSEDFALNNGINIYDDTKKQKLKKSLSLAQILTNHASSDSEKALAGERLTTSLEGVIRLPDKPRIQIELLRQIAR